MTAKPVAFEIDGYDAHERDGVERGGPRRGAAD